jgi:hypothetical protein
MGNLVIRKKISNFNNRQVDEFLLRAVTASGSLKNNAFSKYVSDLSKSANEFHNLRMALSTADYTAKIHAVCGEADDVFRKIRLTVEYSSQCLSGQEQSAALKIQPVISHYGNIAATGVVKKFADYDAFVKEMKKNAGAVSVLKLDAMLNQIAALTAQYRNLIVLRDTYCCALKGKRHAARLKALEDYTALRDCVEAFAVINSPEEVAEFVGHLNESLIIIGVKRTKKKE